jgi:hypothetical protein
VRGAAAAVSAGTVVGILCFSLVVAQVAGARGLPFAESWIDGAQGPEPQIQVQRYDEDTYVLRQSIKTNFEGPFLYLFFGTNRVP